MKIIKSLTVCVLIAGLCISQNNPLLAMMPPPPPPSGGFSPGPSSGGPACADTCGYAVVDSSGVVHGVIVCQQGCFGGTMPHDYMGCPAGCSLVLQSPADSNGNVAGVHGPNVVYTPDTNTFSRVEPDTGSSWTLIGGSPLDSAIVFTPPPTSPPQEQQPNPDIIDNPNNTEPAPSTPETTPPSEPEQDEEVPSLLTEIIEFIKSTPPDQWPDTETLDATYTELIAMFYDELRALALSIWANYFPTTEAE